MPKWFETVEKENSDIISSRIRLVRNWEAYSFPSKLSESESKEMILRMQDELKDLMEVEDKNYLFTWLEDLSELERLALRERRVLNAAAVDKKLPVGMVLSEQEDVCLILNGDDHIRLQFLSPGLHLEELWSRADQMDDYMNARFPYAYDKKYGYLTTFPTNVGTGLRAAVLVHLPTLSTGKKFSNLIGDMGRFGITVRGIYGEGSENYGALYEVSNQKTLGQTEQEIIGLVKKAARQLTDQERQVRELALENHRLERTDEVYKSYGVLCFARRLSRKDAMTFLSQLMLGLADGLIQTRKPCSVYQLMLGIQPANLQKLSECPLGKEELDITRAEYIRRELPKLVD